MRGLFELTIRLGNEQMDDELKLAGALDRVSEEVARGEIANIIRDGNGNTIGAYRLEEAPA